MSKHLVLATIFDFGGSNTHLKTLVKYFGEENTVLVLENAEQRELTCKIGFSDKLTMVVAPGLHKYAHFQYKFSSNVREFIRVLRSIIIIKWLSIKHGFARITVSAVEPEKYLYLLWVPFSRVYYILHTTPHTAYTSFTTFTCNKLLGAKRKIITVSNANKATLIKQWGILAPAALFVCVVPNCVPDAGNDIKEDAVLPSTRLIVVTMGHLIAYKNPELWFRVACKIIQTMNNVNFIWMGDGPLWNEFKPREPAGGRIAFIGKQSDPLPVLRAASVYYQPSLYETQGIGVLEAMSLGLPCVVSEVGGLPESVEANYNGLLVNPNDDDEHVAALTRLLNDKQMRIKYGRNAYAAYRKLFTYSTFEVKMNNVYK
ncbi:glycosyltransferase family 4 protein [Mucilaginibacter sp. BJC16-A38]|uniref:glycosyltransferase family 4 protein n=1 Tax=Mucilaginibacter phenanthrenivorans TaxID=1234842 RepID=UPI0021570C84|nr:glycosyltransferase family 4 protein [Mucilaginibacter phenanthrenivorans]MCR8560192.1 glycosyltransferase family 4 protein [Mucilaginibacter phenanthrenivorans]